MRVTEYLVEVAGELGEEATVCEGLRSRVVEERGFQVPGGAGWCRVGVPGCRGQGSVFKLCKQRGELIL